MVLLKVFMKIKDLACGITRVCQKCSRKIRKAQQTFLWHWQQWWHYSVWYCEKHFIFCNFFSMMCIFFDCFLLQVSYVSSKFQQNTLWQIITSKLWEGCLCLIKLFGSDYHLTYLKRRFFQVSTASFFSWLACLLWIQYEIFNYFG